MILLHRLDGSPIYINANHIELVEATPDTVIKLVNDKTYVVKESVEEVIEKIIKYNQMIFKGYEKKDKGDEEE